MTEKPQILIVDDEVDMCWALENILIPAGYKTYSVTRGKGVLELIKQLHAYIRVILLDVKLPDADGLKLANLIRQQYPKIKIIIISGYYYCDTEAIQQGLAKGLFDGFIGKPFNIPEIRAEVEKLLPPYSNKHLSA